MRPLLVGEANPYGADPEFALYPAPPGCAGDRLCRLVLGLDPDDYLERFERVNLCPSKWSTKVAVARAAEIWDERRKSPMQSSIVMLGAKVTRAFGWSFEPFTVRGYRMVCLPHPSGLSRAWHVSGAYERARVVLREAGILPAA